MHTENINNVLPTIISRCLNLRLSKASKRELVVEVIKKDSGMLCDDQHKVLRFCQSHLGHE